MRAYSCLTAGLRRAAAACALLLAAASPALAAAPPVEDPGALARRWDYINFELHDQLSVDLESDRLLHDAEALAQAQPSRAEPLIWQAAAILAKADAHHDLGSLPLVNKARKLLERATALGAAGDDGGFAWAVLGTLYGEMPGFPIGFGDANTARADFQRAVALAPNNIEVNVLYGTFLLHQHDTDGAAALARRALNAPPRPGRPIGDRRRREEAQALLAAAMKQKVR